MFDLRGNRLQDVINHLLDLAATHATAMKKQAISTARQTELREALAGFGSTKNTGRQQTVAGQSVRLTTGQRFAAVAELLDDRLKRNMRKYKRLAPEFYTRVISARAVLDHPGSQDGSTSAQ